LDRQLTTLRRPARADTPMIVNIEVSMSVGGVWTCAEVCQGERSSPVFRSTSTCGKARGSSYDAVEFYVQKRWAGVKKPSRQTKAGGRGRRHGRGPRTLTS
jgi:hypothetical protein